MDCPFCDEFSHQDKERVKDHMVDSHRSELPSYTDAMNCPREGCGGIVPAGARRCNLNDHDHARYFAGIKISAGETVTHINGKPIEEVLGDGCIPDGYND